MTSKIDLAQGSLAPSVSHCAFLAEGDQVRLAFLGGADDGSPFLVSAVTLTRSQLSGLAGMAAALLDADDLHAISLS